MKQPKDPNPGSLSSLVPEYQPTPKERAAWEAFLARECDAAPAPHFKVDNNGQIPELTLRHADQGFGAALLMNAFGTTDADFFNRLLRQLAGASAQGEKIDEGTINFMLAAITGIRPKDEVECMLAAQMAVVHTATMSFAQRLARSENIPQQESAERALNKLARTFCAQVEALKRYRTGGEQKVTVQHLNVSDGGKAIVGNVSHGGERGKGKNDG